MNQIQEEVVLVGEVVVKVPDVGVDCSSEEEVGEV